MNPETVDAASFPFFDKGTWAAMFPHMHIEDNDFLQRQVLFQLDETSAESVRTLLHKEGYVQIDPPAWGLPLADMAQVVADLEARGLPTPFSFVYDEFWSLYFRLNKIIEVVLGKGFARLPDFWTWRIDPKQSQSGWRPHRDKGYQALFANGAPKSLTIWIPLSDSTTLNGCMYIVPADRDPTYGTAEDKVWRFAYPDIRALPAKAGTILCWNQAVLHWGSHASERESAARVSVAFEFQSASAEPFNQPLTDPYSIPDLKFRVQLIAKQILQYKHMYPLAPDIEKMAHTMLAAG